MSTYFAGNTTNNPLLHERDRENGRVHRINIKGSQVAPRLRMKHYARRDNGGKHTRAHTQIMRENLLTLNERIYTIHFATLRSSFIMNFYAKNDVFSKTCDFFYFMLILYHLFLYIIFFLCQLIYLSVLLIYVISLNISFCLLAILP
jgi:hypothetical protein